MMASSPMASSPTTSPMRDLPSLSPIFHERQLRTISQINNLPHEQMTQAYRCLIPPELPERFGIDPETLTDREGYPLFTCRSGIMYVKLALYHERGARDPLMYLQLADTSNNQIEVVLLIMNDPASERFDTDRMPDDTSTLFSTLARNVDEETRAMKAGLAPGQVRRGLRMIRKSIPILEQFIAGLHRDIFYAQPLAYHSAILMEQLGFAYGLGMEQMNWIHQQFVPGGTLFNQLDGSSPFRQPGAETSVRGRSWAIHDGILGHSYSGVKMYKQVGVHAGVITYPDAKW